jgi:hypothetical protein
MEYYTETMQPPELPQKPPPEEATAEALPPIPWGTVIVLAFLVAASLGTGIFHWYRNYFNPAEEAPRPAATYLADAPVTPPPTVQTPPAETPNQQPDNDAEAVTEPQRPVMEPLPEFVALRAEHGNDSIVAVLTIAESEALVVQLPSGERTPPANGWVLLDYEVDLLMGLDHNMVIYVPVGAALREAIQEYISYDFFLMHPMLSLSTLYGAFDWEIFAFYIAPDIFPIMTVNHPTDNAWGDMVEQFTVAAMYNTRLDVTQYDQVITIASPTGAGGGLYYVLQARLLRHITS